MVEPRYRRSYAYPTEPRRRGGAGRLLKNLILLIIVGAVIWYGSQWLLSLFGIGDFGSRRPITATVESAPVRVAFEGGLLQETEDTVPLYAEDRIATGAGGSASLTLLDGSEIFLDENTEVAVVHSSGDEDDGMVELMLVSGRMWVDSVVSTGTPETMERIVQTESWETNVPAGMHALVGMSQIAVVENMSDDLTVTFATEESVTLSEGQMLTIPESLVGQSAIGLRSAITPSFYEDSFIIARQADTGGSTRNGQEGEQPVGLLTINRPSEGQAVSTQTVQITGEIDESVDRVRVNGYQANIDRRTLTFTQELSVSEAENGSLRIQVEALDERGLIVERASRTVQVATQDLSAPTITEPSGNGTTFRTNAEEVVIRGTVPQGTAGVRVNDYSLQLFDPTQQSWNYVASRELGNLVVGTNTYNVVALDAAGNAGATATITIVWGQGNEGVQTSSTPSQENSISGPTSDENLPGNDPLSPGVLTVTSPIEGTTYSVPATSTGFLLEGGTSANTATVWVNGYRLRLYEAGKTFWNYIASTELSTLQRGENQYEVIARDSENRIIDRLIFTATFNP